MHTRRFRALAIASVTTAVLSGIMVGGLAATAPAAPHKKITTVSVDKLKPAARVARDHAAEGRRLHAADAKAKGKAPAADDSCLSTTDPTQSVIADRIGGQDRYAVGVCVSQTTWFDSTDPDPAHQDWVADAVVLARGDLFADALAGGPLAAQVEGPLLLTKPTSLPANVGTELQRVLRPGGLVYLLGGTGSISDSVNSTIVSLGYQTKRIAGSDRFQTAINIAKSIPDTSNFFITDGTNFPDALGAGNAAAMYTIGAKYSGGDYRPVVLLFSKGTTMPAASTQYANERGEHFGVWALLTAGGAGDTAAVRAFREDNLSVRYVGHTRYDTAALIAQDNFTDLETGKLYSPAVGLVSGTNFPDALTGTVPMALTTSALLLTPPTKLDAAPATFLRNHAGDATPHAYIEAYGGPASISDSVVFSAVSAFTPTA